MFNELRSVLRSLTRAPGYALAIVGILALGLGSATAIYSVVAGWLFPDRQYPDADRLVRVESVSKGDTYSLPMVFLPHVLACRENTTSFTGAACAQTDTLNLVLNGEPEGASVARITADYFPLLGVVPALGRTFLPGEDKAGAPAVAVLTYGLWRDRFGSDPAVVGRDLTLNERSYRVIGVLPRDFSAPLGASGRLYLPLALPTTATAQRSPTTYSVIARLKPGITPAQAQAELRTFRPAAGTPFADYIATFQTVVTPIAIKPSYPGFARIRLMFWTALGAVGFLYAIACVNAGGLMLVRSLGQRRELGIRLALGGSRWAVVRPIILESLVLALVSILAGVLVAKWLFPALMALAPGSDGTTMTRTLTLSWRTLGFLAALGLLTGLVVAAVPAWRSARLDANDTLKEGGQVVGESRRLRALRGGLVVIEAALAVTLLTGAGLMVRTFQRLQNVALGYDPSHKLAVHISLPRDERLAPDVHLARCNQFVERLSHLPGVHGAALASVVVPSGYSPRKLRIADRPEAGDIEAEGGVFSPEYLATLGVKLRAGQNFDQFRPGGPGIVLINETMARKYFPDRNPVGQRLDISAREKLEIVGIVGDIRTPREDARPRYYTPHWQSRSGSLSILVRTAGEPGPKVGAELRRAIYEVDPKFAVSSIQTLEKRLAYELALERLMLTVLEVLAGLALLLAALGLFAMLAYTIDQRRGEFGIRLTLGAAPGSIYQLVIGRGLVLTFFGVVLGLGAAAGLSRFLESLLYETSRHDPLTYGLVGAVMLLVAVPACWLPARRAARVNPVEVLRAQ
jgi:putative ABC transport system permease protein